jgi:hypothetical protein
MYELMNFHHRAIADDATCILREIQKEAGIIANGLEMKVEELGCKTWLKCGGPNPRTRYWLPSIALPLPLWPLTHLTLMQEINDSGD